MEYVDFGDICPSCKGSGILMAVINSKTFPGNFTPICNSCGVCLCYDIGADEYVELKEFWDNWECKNCNIYYKGAKQRFIKGMG